MNKLLIALFCLALCLFGPSTYAQNIKPQFKVKLEVSCNDEIKNEIYSYLSRELRSLGDVVLVDSNEYYTIQIVGMTTKTKDGYNAGITLSTLFM